MVNFLIRGGPLGKVLQFMFLDVIVNRHAITEFAVSSKIRLQNGVNAQPSEILPEILCVKPIFCAVPVPA
jgi:hypothetical protein